MCKKYLTKIAPKLSILQHYLFLEKKKLNYAKNMIIDYKLHKKICLNTLIINELL